MYEYGRTAVKLSKNKMGWLTLFYSPIMPAIPLTTYSGVSRRSYIGSEFEEESITNYFEN
jgi:hypothetical protein